ncbi:hypothetical protein [Saccharopolyspora phatthalungensis]|uniref:ABC-type nickel/cobalt efflux system permease component RcnA n=1 Tax=Saccharopolyspora phatthalungensis TaxID=664693 RepID=A0A840QJ64_9PSEU|nr:hypothetical protein [Saccharopolyspora phatthalungensis]MBB5157653.1 ABC-type nickel/cobalt efflux system permease component RcnA [Saccharopolyspora phatthalungensis]
MIVLVVVWVAWLTWQLAARQHDAAEQAGRATLAEQQAVDNAEDARQVADPLAELCATDPSIAARVGDACRKAVEVQRQPDPTPARPRRRHLRRPRLRPRGTHAHHHNQTHDQAERRARSDPDTRGGP